MKNFNAILSTLLVSGFCACGGNMIPGGEEFTEEAPAPGVPSRNNGDGNTGNTGESNTKPNVPATPVEGFPQGHHVFNFLQDRTNHVSSSGWDPAQVAVSQTNKQKLVDVFNSTGCNGAPCKTFDVGLPGGIEPSGVAHQWTFGNELSPSILDAAIQAGAPGISILSPNPSGVSGIVYHIDSYENCNGDGADGCNGLRIVAPGNYVITRSAFGMVNESTDNYQLWILDSLLDAQDGQAAGINTWGTLNLMYSEVLGGADAAKLSSNQTFYRSHIHGPTLAPGGHADGVQLHSGTENVFFIENNVDMTYRKHNGAYWAKSTGAPMGQAYLYRNIFGGGLHSTWFAGGEVPWAPGTFNVMRDNLYFSTATNGSTGNDGIQDNGTPHSSSAPMHSAGNVTMDGATVNVGGGAPTTAEDKAVADKVAQLEIWVKEMRAAAGY